MQALIQQLFDGPIDIIGDIHGEYGVLCALLTRLGYDANGNHKDGRRLIFVGDLVDRGIASVSVLRLVRSLVNTGKAQCVLGNHEFNLIRKPNPTHRHGNHWFFGEIECLSKDTPQRVHFQELATESDRKWILEWLSTLPFALENDHLRVVHACWDQRSIDRLRADQAKHNWPSLIEAYEFYKEETRRNLAPNLSEQKLELIFQNEHPLKVLATGLEEHCDPPYYAGGKMRHMKRVTWWDSYQDHKKVVVGHYWRKRFAPKPNLMLIDKKDVPVLFRYDQPYHWLGNDQVMCIDYSIGQSFFEREHGILDGESGMALCAMRWPEEELWFHDGMKQQIIKSKSN
jgi:hypothetical protein